MRNALRLKDFAKEILRLEYNKERWPVRLISERALQPARGIIAIVVKGVSIKR